MTSYPSGAFGIVGSAYMDALDIFPAAGLRFIPTAHEQGAGHMAAGYARRGLCGLLLHWLPLRPAVGGDEFLYRNLADPDRMLFLARLPSLVLGLSLGGLVFHWAARIGGGAAGILALTA